MKPVVKFIASDAVDESFTALAESIIQKEFDRIPDALWNEAYRDIKLHGKVLEKTLNKIGKYLKLI